ncbi:MAG TPA: hypothetical protein VK464_02470 [Symbiobacteriaceae bacterium]|nr:hypothetical protein [Symbiobacteriaceae bacterium]
MGKSSKAMSQAQGKRFKRVTSSFSVAGGARRGAAAVEVSPTGLVRTNVASTGYVMNLVDASEGDRKRFHLAYGTNEATKEVALYVVPPDAEGAMAVRVYAKTISFHIGNAFLESPKLRPEARGNFSVSDVTTDAEGVPCVIMTLKAGLDSRKTRTTTTTAAQEKQGARK